MKALRLPVTVLTLILAGFCLATDVKAQPKWTYNANFAATYAVNNHNVAYGSGQGQNPFGDFTNNCANFVSQSIVAGLTGKTTPSDVFAQRYNFTADRDYSLSWYYISAYDRRPAWTGAKNLYQYAKSNKSTHKGLHFTYVTNDSPNYRMNYDLIIAGDVIFADWESDGTVDHVMIVTKVYSSLSSSYIGYDRIRVTSQSNNVTDRGLEDISKQYNYKVSFYVYRPTDYNQNGL
jgi:hypothetical protein